MKNNDLHKEYTEAVPEALRALKEPSFYQVFVYNDDFTPMEFVINALERFFFMSRRQAAAVTLTAHIEGRGQCGVFTRDVAETKVSMLIDYARLHEHPLACNMEVIDK
ncbi:MAG TPA: ATP-dependent Clp protease adapter ClpS [Gammaproteobacteria bacterium]|jgi:ATP-dependent Clp protease adaptor protein ClpS|nr:ATP-dependent Clp protease adapter ClpS [Gammaproteobacteria bacterium]